MTFQSCILACTASKKSPPFAFFSKLFCQMVPHVIDKKPEKVATGFSKSNSFLKDVAPKLSDTYFTLKYVIFKI